MSENIINIGPVSGNPDAAMKLIFGNKVSASQVIGFVERSAKVIEKAGLITSENVTEMVKEAEEELKKIKVA